MLKIKNNSQSPKISLEDIRSSLNMKRVSNIKEENFSYRSIILPKKIVSNSSNESLIFKKKKSPIKTISYINNDTGKMRHFTPAAQEWFNSIYSYNKDYLKTLPTADKNVMRLLKSYFNFFINHKLLKTKRIANRYRKLSANKVFIGKGELKHTNEKLIITSYVYNAEQLYLKSLIRKEAKSLYYPNKKLKKEINIDRNNKDVVIYNRPFTLKEYLNLHNNPDLPNHPKLHKEVCFKLFWKQYIKLIGMKRLKDEEKKNKEKEKKFEKKYGGKEEAKIFLESVKFKMIYLDKLNSIINNNTTTAIENLINSSLNNNTITTIENFNFNELKLKDQIEIIFFRDFSNIHDDITYQNFINSLLELVEEKNEEKLSEFKEQVFRIRKFFSKFDLYMTMAKNNYLNKLNKFVYLLMVNTVKFKTPFVSKLLRFLKNIYNKKVELNIVNLNKIHLNSDIYTQAVSLKLRNRDNKLFRVLTWSLNKVKLPNVSRITERYNVSNRDEYLINKIRNMYINSMFNTNIDPLNNLLLDFFSKSNNLEVEIKKRSSIIKRPITLYKYIIRSLKHLKLAGIRVEAKGRLTRRFTASRSVFKMKWKGGLKNVDSSFKGLSAIMLRGDRKSNVQYSMLSSRNRNGAYGVKGWVSSK
jgi:hypothetical protein